MILLRAVLFTLLAVLCIAVVVRRDTDQEPTPKAIGLILALAVVFILLVVTES